MQSLRKQDLFWILRRLPRPVVNLMKTQLNLFMAGGFIRACVAGEEAQDVDLFAPDLERAELYARVLVVDKGSAVFRTKNALTIRLPEVALPIQVIHRWTYAKPEDLIESFDFTVAKGVVWFNKALDNWDSLVHDDFYADLAAKRLVYTKPQRNEDAGGSLLRVLKFYQKGYRIPLDSLAKVAARLMLGVRSEALGALAGDHETALGIALTGLLHEVDPLQDPHHIFHLPSESEVNAPALDE